MMSRLFQCSAGGKAAQARAEKIKDYEFKKYATSRGDSAVAATTIVKPDPSISDVKRPNSDPVAAYTNSNTDDAMTNPIQSDEEDTTESPNHDEAAATASAVVSEHRQQSGPPVTSPMSVLSEQTAPEVTSPPRILEKLDNAVDEQMEGATADVNPTLKSAGLLCGCL